MRHIKSILLPVVLAILLPVIASAATMVKGTVMMTSPGNLLIMSAGGEQLGFAVPAGTHITRDGQQVKLDELQARDKVSIAASQTGDDRVATEIMARSPY